MYCIRMSIWNNESEDCNVLLRHEQPESGEGGGGVSEAAMTGKKQHFNQCLSDAEGELFVLNFTRWG